MIYEKKQRSERICIRGDQFVRVKKTPGGYTINLDINATQARIPKVSGIGTQIRKAYIISGSSTGKTISCYLDTDGTGNIVSVYFEIIGGNANLSDCFPLFDDGDRIFVLYNDEESRWEYVGGNAISAGDCDV
ncbi:MAG: hypothetical protein PVG39_30700 [Desulfobacteraceae bacterium]|jgi:hypothetical protein